MKKILTLLLLISMSTSISLAASSFGSTVKNAVKQDIVNQKQAQTNTAAAKKEEKIKQIDTKLSDLNKELSSVKNDKSITETERTLKTKTLQRQIDFYNNQKKALQ